MSLSKDIYALVPAWAQNVMVSAQGLFFAYRRWDVELGRRLLDELNRSQTWSEDRFAHYQISMLREHLEYAAASIPYYRELFRKEGMDPSDIRHVEDLKQIPVLEKSVIKRQPLQFLQGGRVRRSWNRHFTSGTTGTPLRIYSSRESFTRLWSFVFRLRQWAGISDPIFPRRVAFTGRLIVPRGAADGCFWRWNLPGRTLLMSVYHISHETVSAYAKAMSGFRPQLIDGYPSPVATIARMARSMGQDLPEPKALVLTSETLFDPDRKDIESAFRSRIFNQYAATDTGAFICECEHGNMHINPEYGICEILDPEGKPVAPGEEGEIVATPFHKREQVFIRYKTGDTAVRGVLTTCPCGRSMPLVKAVTGRVEDTLYVPGRGFMQRFDATLKGLDGIYEVQVVQESLDRLQIFVVPDHSYDRKIEAALLKNLRAQVGDAVEITLSTVDAIPRGPNGKFAAVSTKCREQYPR